MLTAVLADAGDPVVAGLLGLGAVGLAAAVVVMAWSVHVYQIPVASSWPAGSSWSPPRPPRPRTP